MISQTVEYALRAIVTIAQHEGKPCTAKKSAEITQVPLPYLSKLMQGLVRGKLVNSQLGLDGGFLLAKVMEATETILRATTLAEMLAQPGSVTPLCEEKKLVSLGLGNGPKKAAQPAKKKR